MASGVIPSNYFASVVPSFTKVTVISDTREDSAVEDIVFFVLRWSVYLYYLFKDGVAGFILGFFLICWGFAPFEMGYLSKIVVYVGCVRFNTIGYVSLLTNSLLRDDYPIVL